MAKTAAWGYGTVVMMDRRERAAAALLGEQMDGRESCGGAAQLGENSCMGKRSIKNLDEVTFAVVLDGRRCCCFRCW